MYKRILSFLLTLCMVISMVPFGAAAEEPHEHEVEETTAIVEETVPETVPETTEETEGDISAHTASEIVLEMHYDDYLTAEELADKLELDSVNLSEVGVGELLEVVDLVLYPSGASQTVTYLRAKGVGETTLTVGEAEYAVVISAAPLSVMLIIGQSNGAGLEGEPAKSVANKPGQVYSTHAAESLTTTNGNTYIPKSLTENVNRAGSALTSSKAVNAMTAAGVGVQGLGSGYAYKWNQLTGDKVWVLNASHSGTNIASWQPNNTSTSTGQDGAHYQEMMSLLENMVLTLDEEVSAGHYTISGFNYIWLQGCYDSSNTTAYYLEKFDVIHAALTSYVMNINDVNYYFGNCGLIPTRQGGRGMGDYDKLGAVLDQSGELLMNGPRVAQYYMGYSKEARYSNVFLVSDLGEEWITNETVAASFAARYPGQTNVDYISANGTYLPVPTSVEEAHPNIHYRQAGYNELGLDSAANLYYQLNPSLAPAATATVDFRVGGTLNVLKNGDSYEAAASVNMVPVVSPTYLAKKVTVTAGEGRSYSGYTLTTNANAPSGALTASVNGRTVSTVTLPGEEPHVPSSYYWDFDAVTENTQQLDSVTTGDYAGYQRNSMKSTTHTFTEGGVVAWSSNQGFELDKEIILKKDMPWEVEFEAKATGSRWMPLSLGRDGTNDGSRYIFVFSNNVQFGYAKNGYNGTGVNTGVTLQNVNHIYRLVNEVDAVNGTHQVRLYVDGNDKGILQYKTTNGSIDAGNPVNLTYVDQNFEFKHFASYSYMELGNNSGIYSQTDFGYLKVQECTHTKATAVNGSYVCDYCQQPCEKPYEDLTANSYYWNFDAVTEATNSVASVVTGDYLNYQRNEISSENGTIGNGGTVSYTSNAKAFEFTKPINLRKDMPWEVEFQAYSGDRWMPLADNEPGNRLDGRYILAMSSCVHVGNTVQIDGKNTHMATASNTIDNLNSSAVKIRLVNQVFEGGHYVHMYVNNQYKGILQYETKNVGTTNNVYNTDYLDHDFVFPYFAAYTQITDAKPLNLDYLKIQECTHTKATAVNSGYVCDYCGQSCEAPTAQLVPQNYYWNFDQVADGTNKIESVAGDGLGSNYLDNASGTVKAEGVITTGYANGLKLGNPVTLSPDLPWVIEFQGNTSNRFMLFNRSGGWSSPSDSYIYLNNGVHFGYNDAGAYKATSLALSNLHGRTMKLRLENVILENGGHEVHVYVDDQFMGVANHPSLSGSIDNTKTDTTYVDRNLVLEYFGGVGFTGDLDHLLIQECSHSKATKGTNGYVCDYCGQSCGKPMVRTDNFFWNFNQTTVTDSKTTVATTEGKANNMTLTTGSADANGEMTNAQFRLGEAIQLNHDLPWEVELIGKIDGRLMLLSETNTSTGTEEHRNKLLWFTGTDTYMGFHTGSAFDNTGIRMTGVVGANRTVKVRYENHIENGESKVYVFVNDNLVGQLKYRGENGFSATEGATVDTSWLKNADFNFLYLGTNTYAFNGDFESLKIQECAHRTVVEKVLGYTCADCGQLCELPEEPEVPEEPEAPEIPEEPTEPEEPEVELLAKSYYWNFDAVTENTQQLNSVTTGDYAGYQKNSMKSTTHTFTEGGVVAWSSDQGFELEKEIILKKDMPWEIEFTANASGSRWMPLSTMSHGSNTGSRYLFIYSNVVQLGYATSTYDGTGVAVTNTNGANHVFRLVNEVDTVNKTHQVRLYIDGVDKGILQYKTLSGSYENNPPVVDTTYADVDFAFKYFASYSSVGTNPTTDFGYLKVQECTHTEATAVDGVYYCDFCEIECDKPKENLIANSYYWDFDAVQSDTQKLKTVTTGDYVDYQCNAMSSTTDTITKDGKITWNGSRGFDLETPINLRPDMPWEIEMVAEASQRWMPLNANPTSVGGQYFFIYGNTVHICKSVTEGNMGSAVSSPNLCGNGKHTIRLVNRIIGDGHEVVLYVDGDYVGVLNQESKQGSLTGNITTAYVDEVLTYSYFGTYFDKGGTLDMDYLKVRECTHTEATYVDGVYYCDYCYVQCPKPVKEVLAKNYYWNFAGMNEVGDKVETTTTGAYAGYTYNYINNANATIGAKGSMALTTGLQLNTPVTLRANFPWVLEIEGNIAARWMPLTQSAAGGGTNERYYFINSSGVQFGVNDSGYKSTGLSVSSLLGSNHKIRLENVILENGHEVHVYVDDAYKGILQYYGEGGNIEGTINTSYVDSDMTFSYFGAWTPTGTLKHMLIQECAHTRSTPDAENHYICDYCNTDLGLVDVHNYVKGQFVWKDNYTVCELNFTCVNCHSNVPHPATISSRVAAGENRAVATVTVNGITYTEEQVTGTNNYMAQGGTSDTYYETLEEAFDSNNSVIRLLDGVVIRSDITIPAGKTLLLPYSATDNRGINTGKHDMDGDVAGTEIGRVSTTDMAWNHPEYLYTTATIANTATVTVYGTLTVGGMLYYPDTSSQSHTSGNYAHLINMGTIVLAKNNNNSQARMNAPGLVTGSGSINLGSTGTLKLPFLINDFAGGNVMYAMQDESEFLAMNNFAVNNVQCTVNMFYGAMVKGYGSLYVGSKGMYGMMDAGLIGPSGTTNNYFLYMDSESAVTMTYNASKKLNANIGLKSTDFGKLTITVTTGNVQGGSFEYSYDVVAGVYSIGASTAGKYLPLPYTMDIVVNSGATLTLPNNDKTGGFAIMPGAKVEIKSGGNLIVNGKLQVLEGWNRQELGTKRYPTSMELQDSGFAGSGQLIVDGTMTINRTATFAGTVQSTGTTGKIKVYSDKLSGTFSNGTEEYSETIGWDLSWIGMGDQRYYIDLADNKATYSLIARVHNGTSYTNLAKDKTYYAVGGTSWTLDSFVMEGFIIEENLDRDGETVLNTVTINEPMTGIWAENQTVRYDSNGGSGEMAAQTVNFGTTFALIANTFTREGYIFQGWNTAADGSGVAYADGAEIKAAQANGAVVTLYAQWHQHDYGSWQYDEAKHWKVCACGDEISNGTHQYNAGEIVTLATCTTDGSMRFTCESCGYSYNKVIPMLAHGNVTVNTAWENNDATHWKTCPDCKEKVQEAVHNYVDGECEVCGAEETVEEEIVMTSYKTAWRSQIGLIEPWFLRVNVAIADAQLNQIDYSKLTDYGFYFIRESNLDNAGVPTTEDLVNDADAVCCEKSTVKTQVLSGGRTYFYADYDKGLYTYEMSESIYAVFYFELENGGREYTVVKSFNLKQLLNERKDDTDFGELERAVYTEMSQLEADITAYRVGKTGTPMKMGQKLTVDNLGVPATDAKYKYAANTQIVIIEPWGIQINAAIVPESGQGVADHVDYATAEDYGMVMYYDVDGSITDPTQLDTVEEMLELTGKAYIFSKENGAARDDVRTNYITARYYNDVYTYQLDTTVYAMFYLKQDGKYYYSNVRPYNVYDLAVDRGNDSGFGDELERNVYQSMVRLYAAITMYREDYFQRNEK